VLKKLLFVIVFVVVLIGSTKLGAEERSIKIYKTPSVTKTKPGQLFCKVPEYVKLFKMLEVEPKINSEKDFKVDIKQSVFDVLCTPNLQSNQFKLIP